MTGDEERHSNTQLYKRRWVFLLANGIFSLAVTVVPISFSVSNYIYTVYFDVSYSSFDWMYIAAFAGTFMITPLYAWLSCKKFFGLRLILILSTVCILFTCLNILMSIQYPVLFPLAVVANLFSGLSYGAVLTLPPLFSTLWFPNHEVGLAIAVSIIFQCLGVYTGSILPSWLFQSEAPITNTTIGEGFSDWKLKIRIRSTWVYAAIAVVLVILLLFFVIFVTDEPPKPPTHALWLKKNEYSEVENHPFEFLETTRVLLCDLNFLVAAILNGLMYNQTLALFPFFHSIVSAITANQFQYLPFHVINFITLTVHAATTSTGLYIASKILTKFYHLKGLTIIASVISFSSSIGFLLSCYYRSLIAFFVFMFTQSLSIAFGVVPLNEIVTQHTYPIDELVSSTWVAGLCCGFIVLLVLFYRLVFYLSYGSNIAVFIASSVIALLMLILSMLFRPKNKRRQADESANLADTTARTLSETTTLLHEQASVTQTYSLTTRKQIENRE